MPKPLIFDLEGNAAERFQSLMSVVRGNTDAMEAFKTSVAATNPEIAKESDALVRLRAAVEANKLKSQDFAATQAKLDVDTQTLTKSIRILDQGYRDEAKGINTADTAGKSNNATMDQSIQRIKLETQALMALRNTVGGSVASVKNMTTEQLQSVIAMTRHTEASAKFEKTQKNIIPGMEGMSVWMQRFHMDAAHYAAMIDRITGMHTGLATVLRSGFIPSLIGIGIAMSAVNIAVHAWQKRVEEAEKATNDAIKGLIEYSDNLIATARSRSELNQKERDAIDLALYFKDINLKKELQENSDAIEYQGGAWLAYGQAVKSFGGYLKDFLGNLWQINEMDAVLDEDLKKLGSQYDENAKKVEALRHRQEELRFAHDHGGRSMAKYAEDQVKLNDRLALAEVLGNANATSLVKQKQAVDELDRKVAAHIITYDEYFKLLKIVRLEFDEQQKDIEEKERKKGEAAAKAAAAHKKAWLDAMHEYSLEHANAYEKVEEATKKHLEKLRALLLTHPEHRKEIMAMILGTEMDGAQKLVQIAAETAARRQKFDDDTAMRWVKLSGDRFAIINAEYSKEMQALDDLLRKKEISEENYNARVKVLAFERVKAEMDAANKVAQDHKKYEEETLKMGMSAYQQRRAQLVREYQEAKHLRDADGKNREMYEHRMTAIEKKLSEERIKQAQKERNAKIQAAFAVSHAAISLAEMTGNKQIAKVAKVVDFVEKAYSAWKQIEAALAIFRSGSELATARVAIQTNTTQAGSAAAQQSQLAAVNAFASAAAIPYVGWMIAPGAMATAEAMTAPMAGVISAIGSAATGALQAHKGISVPQDGSYFASFKKGEVMLPNTSAFTDVSTAITKIAEEGRRGSQGGGITINMPISGGVIGQKQIEMAVGRAAKKAARYGVR